MCWVFPPPLTPPPGAGNFFRRGLGGGRPPNRAEGRDTFAISCLWRCFSPLLPYPRRGEGHLLHLLFVAVFFAIAPQTAPRGGTPSPSLVCGGCFSPSPPKPRWWSYFSSGKGRGWALSLNLRRLWSQTKCYFITRVTIDDSTEKRSKQLKTRFLSLWKRRLD